MGRILFVGFMVVSLVIINNLYIKSIAVFKTKAESPLVIYANTPLALAISTQGFQSVTRRGPKIINRISVIKYLKFTFSNVCK